MLHVVAELPLKQNILIADTILAEADPEPGFKVWGSKYIFRGKHFYFYHMFKTNFSEHNKIWGDIKRFGGNCPLLPHRGCRPGQNRRQKVFHWEPSCFL